MRAETRKRDIKKAAIIALFIHVALAVLFFFLIVGFKTIPPLEEQWVEMGMADFGDFSDGGGKTAAVTPKPQTSQESTSQPQPVEHTQASEDVVTQESSDVSTTSQPETSEETEPEPEKVPSALDNILNQINDEDGGATGPDDGPGDSGDPDGTDGGTGHGPRKGPGFDIEGFGGRGLVGKPKLTNDHSSEGVVCLKLVANRSGKIIEANYKANCSTTSSADLISRAKASVIGIKLISPKADAGVRDIGTIRITFKLQ